MEVPTSLEPEQGSHVQGTFDATIQRFSLTCIDERCIPQSAITSTLHRIASCIQEGEHALSREKPDDQRHTSTALNVSSLLARWRRFCRVCIADVLCALGYAVMTGTDPSPICAPMTLTESLLQLSKSSKEYLREQCQQALLKHLEAELNPSASTLHSTGGGEANGDHSAAEEGEHHHEISTPFRQHVKLPVGIIAGPQLERGQRIFPYGNYNTYYSLRRETAVFSSAHDGSQSDSPASCLYAQVDPRLSVIQAKYGADVFRGKTVLDIGCNVGLISFTVAGVLGAASVMGIDIDAELISKGLEFLRAMKYQYFYKFHERFGHSEKKEVLQPFQHFLPPAPQTLEDVHPVFRELLQSDVDTTVASDCFPSVFPFNIELRAMDFVKAAPEEHARCHDEADNDRRFDTILALSVTKWIHINFGDDALKRCFRRMYRLLRPGGYLILEPQSWDSYRKKRRLQASFKTNLQQIELKPQRFDEFLCQDVGFEHVDCLGVKTEDVRVTEFFSRPLFIYKKN